MTMRRELIMIGSAREAHSGIASVVNVYFAQGLFRRWRARYLETHADGSRAYKAALAARAWLAFLLRLLTGRVGLLHVLAASDASFWRKTLFVLPAHFMGVPYVLHLHCGKYVAFFRRSPPWVRRLIAWQLRRAQAVIALSEELRGELEAIAPGARVISIPNPIPIPAWQASLREGQPTVLFLGVLKPHKGIDDLMRAWPAVLARVPQARLVLGGAGDLAAVRARAESLGIAHALELPGWVVGAEKEALLRRAWALALPSYAEALPMAILEAMAAGVPVVATRIAGIPLAVVPGETGELITPGDVEALARELVTLLTDEPRRLAMGAAARRRALERFSADALLPHVEALWRETAPAAERAPQEAARGAAGVRAQSLRPR